MLGSETLRMLSGTHWKALFMCFKFLEDPTKVICFFVCPLSTTKQQQQQSSTTKLIHSYNEIWYAFVCRQPMMKSKQLWRQPLKAQVKADTWDIQMKRLCQVISLETLTPAFLMPKLGFLLVQPLSRLLHGKALWSWNNVALLTCKVWCKRHYEQPKVC